MNKELRIYPAALTLAVHMLQSNFCPSQNKAFSPKANNSKLQCDLCMTELHEE